MKWPLISKLKGPAQQGAEPTEEELTARYQNFKRRNVIGKRLSRVGGIGIALGSLCAILLTNCFGVDAIGAGFGSLSLFLGFVFIGEELIINQEKEDANKPLSDMSEQDRADAQRLIKFIPEARKLNERARKQARALRSFDLKAMRAFEKQRNERRLLRQYSRSLIQSDGVSRTEF